ncbi:MAG: WD40 repeat domain-containing protein [Treponema sp.]|nr:WD40 repeat domain-containing protein [Treponema sp.]
MTKGKKKYWWCIGLALFIAYFFAAARPIQQETVIAPRWLVPLDSDYLAGAGGEALLPFRLGSRFGHLSEGGIFAVHETAQGNISISENFWARHEDNPPYLHIMNPQNDLVLEIEDPRGYPLFLDDRIFIVGIEQNSLAAIGGAGEELWRHYFRAPLTAVDAAGGWLLAGTLDGAIELLDFHGRAVIPPFEPGGSRLPVILGAAISGDAARLALISGIDEQRFLLLEQAGDSFRVVYHQFIGEGFRRPVHIRFADNDRKVIYEREGGLGIFDIASRSSIKLPLRGEIVTLDDCGTAPYLFVITSEGEQRKRLIAIRYPGIIIKSAPFASDTAFFARRGSLLYLGADETMASFELGRR